MEEIVYSVDSQWNQDFLARSVESLKAFQLDFVFTNWVKLRGDRAYSSEWLREGKWKPFQTHRQGEWSLLKPAQIRKMFLERCHAPSSAFLIRRNSIVSGWGEHMRIADDWYLILEMVLHRPCRAAFSLTPRWKKRVDGKNLYDGQPHVENIRKLYLHDHRSFGRDFRPLLTWWEKLNLARRRMNYRLRLLLLESAATEVAARVKIPIIIEQLRSLTKQFDNNPERIGGRSTLDK